MEPKKSLGQHWLHSERVDDVIEMAELDPGDHVLEVGPGTGNMTEMLLADGVSVTAVELDDDLFKQLKRESKQWHSMDVIRLALVHEDILQFDLSRLPADYKVVANIPYYLTGKLIRKLVESDNPPLSITLLIQKEVAQRLAADPGDMSIASVSAQLFGEVKLGPIIAPEYFTPPPTVDSQVVHIVRHSEPLFAGLNHKSFFRIVRAGFGEKRKKLRSSLSGGLHKSKEEIDQTLAAAGIAADARAQELDLNDWHKLWLRLSS